MRIASPGHAALAITLVALGIAGFVKGNFTAIFEPVPKDLPAREYWVYLCASITLGSGIGIVLQRTAATASRVLLAYLVLWLVLFKVSGIVRAPTSQESWSSFGETAVLVAAAWVLYVCLSADWDRKRLNFATGERGLRIATALYGIALIPFGSAHFVYHKETASLVPGWLPVHLFWAYFTGCAFIAAGVAIITRVFARTAAALCALQIGAFTLLVWIPIVAAGHPNAFASSETVLSVALTAAAWVVADSYRGVPWFALDAARVTEATRPISS